MTELIRCMGGEDSVMAVISFRAPARAFQLCTMVMNQHAGVRHGVHGLAQMFAMAASRTSAWRRSF
jgi:hypothetical protein